jgi:hypothetical protein
LQARIEAHDQGYPMVTGSIRNGTPTPAGWASYFLDHAGSLPGRPSGLLDVPPAHCSYERAFLVAAGGFPTTLRAGEDTAVNTALFAQGLKAFRASDVVLTHVSRNRTTWSLLRHHFARGQAFARLLLDFDRWEMEVASLPAASFLREALANLNDKTEKFCGATGFGAEGFHAGDQAADGLVPRAAAHDSARPADGQ